MKITIGEKDFTLKYDNRALFRIEKICNKSVIKIFQDANELEKLSTVYSIVWAGITEPITFDEFSELATFNELAEILPSIIESIAESFDTGDKDVKKKTAVKM